MDARTRLLEVALAAFAARGYDAVGVQEIVEAAGVTKPTLYHHFGNKQGLLEALVAERLRPLDLAIEAACREPQDFSQALRAVVGAYLGFAMENREMYQLWLSMNLGPPGSVARLVASGPLARHRGWLEAVFKAKVGSHGNLRNQYPQLSASLMGMVNAYVSLAWEGTIILDQGVVQEVVRRFLHGVYA